MKMTIEEILGQMLTTLGLPFEKITQKKDGEMTRVDIASSEPSKLIGWHGETLNALQHVLKSIIRSMENLERAPFILLDTDGYRLSQEEKVRKIAASKVDFVRRTGARVTLSPMSPYFRRVVHTFIAATPEFSDVTTESVGEGDYRQVVVRLKSEKSRDDGEELSPVIESDGLENLDV